MDILISRVAAVDLEPQAFLAPGHRPAEVRDENGLIDAAEGLHRRLVQTQVSVEGDIRLAPDLLELPRHPALDIAPGLNSKALGRLNVGDAEVPAHDVGEPAAG